MRIARTAQSTKAKQLLAVSGRYALFFAIVFNLVIHVPLHAFGFSHQTSTGNELALHSPDTDSHSSTGCSFCRSSQTSLGAFAFGERTSLLLPRGIELRPLAAPVVGFSYSGSSSWLCARAPPAVV